MNSVLFGDYLYFQLFNILLLRFASTINTEFEITFLCDF